MKGRRGRAKPQPQSKPVARAPRRTVVLAMLGLCALAGLAYANSFRAELFFDNATMIKDDPRLRAWTSENLRLILTKGYWWALSDSDLYRPVTTLTYLFNYTILGHGEAPAGYHAVNLLLHAANAVMVFLVIWRLAGRRETAWAAAALFAVLPVNTEAVTNIVGRADLLATLAVLAGGWCYLRAAEAARGRRTRWLVAMGLIACLGVLSKENAVMILGAVVLYDALWRWPHVAGTSRAQRLVTAVRDFALKGWVALLPALALLAAIRWWIRSSAPALGPLFGDNPIAHATPVAGVLTAINVLGRYLLRLVLPYELSADYSYNQIPLYGDGTWQQEAWTWMSAAIVAGLIGGAIWWRRATLFAWGVLWLFLMLLPTANLLLPIGTIMAERFLYLPSVGFCAVAALGLLGAGRWMAGRLPAGADRRHILTWTPIVLVLVVFTGRTYVRNDDWRDELVFWRRTVEASPDSHKAHRGYARALWSAGQNEAAADAAFAAAATGLAILERTPLPLERQDSQVLQDLGTYAHYKGMFLQQRGDTEGARRHFREELGYLQRVVPVDRWVNDASRRERIRRGHPPEDIPDVGNFRIYVQLANVYLALDEPTPAWEASLYAQRLGPDEDSAYHLAGVAAYNAGRPRDAIVQFLTVLLLNAQHLEAWDHLVRAYQALGVASPVDAVPGGGHTLRADEPLAREHLTQAAVGLVARFEAARRPADAAYFRALAIDTYGVPAAAFTKPTRQ